jgi:hypothetical protein
VGVVDSIYVDYWAAVYSTTIPATWYEHQEHKPVTRDQAFYGLQLLDRPGAVLVGEEEAQLVERGCFNPNIDTTNDFDVGACPAAINFSVPLPRDQHLDYDVAMRFAAYIVAEGQHGAEHPFREVLAAVQVARGQSET